MSAIAARQAKIEMKPRLSNTTTFSTSTGDHYAVSPTDPHGLITMQNKLSLSQAAKVAAVDGRPPSIPTIFRWATTGIGGVRLAHRRLGRRIITSAAALDHFAEELAAQDEGRLGTPNSRPRAERRPTDRQRQRSYELAERELKEAGL